MFAGGTISEGELKARYERYKNIIDNFTLMSDIFMRNVFKKKECLEYVLQVIMEKQDLHVSSRAFCCHGLCCQRCGWAVF